MTTVPASTDRCTADGFLSRPSSTAAPLESAGTGSVRSPLGISTSRAAWSRFVPIWSAIAASNVARFGRAIGRSSQLRRPSLLTWMALRSRRSVDAVVAHGPLFAANVHPRRFMQWWRRLGPLLTPTLGEPPPRRFGGSTLRTSRSSASAVLRRLHAVPPSATRPATLDPPLPISHSSEGMPVGLHLGRRLRPRCVCCRTGPLEGRIPWSDRCGPSIHG